MENTQEPLFYTADEVVAKVTEALNAAYEAETHKIQRTKDNLSANHAEQLLDVLRQHLDRISEEHALSIYNQMARYCGWTLLDTIKQNLWTVTVTCGYDQVAELEDVEADSEEDAIDFVRDSFDLYDLSATVTFRDHNGHQHDLEVSNLEHELGDYFTDNLDFEASPQE